MNSKVLIAVLVSCVALLVSLGAIVSFHERQDIQVVPGEPRPAVQSASTRAVDPTKRSGGGDASNPRVTLEKRLRLFSVAGHVQRGKIVHSIRERLAVFRPHIISILNEDGAALLEPAVLVAGRLGLDGVKNRLSALLASAEAPIRTAAIRALGYMRQWTHEDAVGVLASERNPAVLRAALEATALLERPPVRSILPFVQHSDWGVVRAARQAMPDEMSEEDVTWISEWTRRAGPSAAIVGIQVLGALAQSSTRDRILVEHSTSKVWSVQLACLEALARDAGPLSDAVPIWKIVEDPNTSIEVKVHALLVLERSKTIDGPRIRQLIHACHPVVKLAAARCLLVAKDREGLRVLVDLLSTVEGPNVDDEDRSCAIEGAHEILVEVSKWEHRPEPEAWSQWYRSHETRLSGALRTAPRLAW